MKRKRITKLLDGLERLRLSIPYATSVNSTVSTANVGWHIQHSALVLLKVIKALETSDPQSYKWTFNLSRVYVFTMNKIPRGKAKAPKLVQPETDASAEELFQLIEKAKRKVSMSESFQKNKHFQHPFFGNLNVRPGITMLRIHTEHHLAIIDDILKK